MLRSRSPRDAVLGAALVVLVMLAGGASARAASPEEMKARASFAAGRYDEALDAFANLYAETLNPIYLRNIGRCHQKLRHPDQAIDAFHDYLAKGKKISADERAEIEGYIKEMEALRDEQAKQAAPPPPPPAVAAAPPAATFTAPVSPIAAGQPPTESSAAAPTGGYPVAVTPAPAGALVSPPAPSGGESPSVFKRWWFWTIIGVAVAGGVVAALLIPGGTTRPPCAGVGLGCQ